MRWLWFVVGAVVLVGGYRLSESSYQTTMFAQTTSPVVPAVPIPREAARNDEEGVELPREVHLEPGRLVTVQAASKGKIIRWLNPHKQVDVIPSESGRWAIVASPTPGRYPIYAYTAINGEPTKAGMCLVIVAGTPPTPVPPEPTPPGPTPPTPPEPTPPAPPAPIPEPGFRVLMIFESSQVDTAQKRAVLASQTIRDYLDAKCVMGPDGKMREWRVWDKDVDTAGDRPVWQNAMKRPRTSVPWIIISTGKTGYEGPLPSTVSETLTLIKKYGGE